MLPYLCPDMKIPVMEVDMYFEYLISFILSGVDRLCGLVVRVSGYRYRGPGFDPRRYQIF